MSSTIAPPRRVLWGIALICFANLMLEIVLTRIFSATMFYHFTFLAISLALFGMGASGVYVYVRAERFRRETVERDLALASKLFAGTTLLAVVYILANPIDLGIGHSKAFEFSRQLILQLILLNCIAALPFFFAGMVVSLAITHYHEHIGLVYFYDLAAAGVAALLCGLFLGLLGGPDVVLLVGVLGVAGATLFQPPKGWRSWSWLGLAVIIFVGNQFIHLVEVPSVKGVKASRMVFEKWNAFSRVTVEELKNGQLDIKIDASAATRISGASKVTRAAAKRNIAALAHSIFSDGPNKVLIIGPGGGPDVVNALAMGAKEVVGVEVNPIIAETIMREKFRKQSGDLYFRDRVKIVTDEGRSFIRRSSTKYDVIQATLVDTWAATAAGAFALTENTLYTIEAFEDYFTHLSDQGVLTMSRWFHSKEPETARLVVLAMAGLMRVGVARKDLPNHIFLARRGNLASLLARRTPFGEVELRQLEETSQASGFNIVLSPRRMTPSPIARMLKEGPYSAFVKNHRRDLSPPTDDRPFFFYFEKPGRLFKLNLRGAEATLVNPAVWILLAFGLAIVLLTVLFIIMPLLLHRGDVIWKGTRRDLVRRIASLGYFAMIGLAFITLEIAMMQKLGLFLGHPSYGLIVVLFAVLTATALGARLSQRVPDRLRAKAALGAALAIAVLGFLYSFALSDLLRDWITWSLWARIVLATIISGTAGVVMGVMLPLGVRLVSSRDPGLIPWGWGVNGASSVVGTVLATMIAIHAGFNRTLIIGSLLYVLAGGMAFALGWLVDARAGKESSAAE